MMFAPELLKKRCFVYYLFIHYLWRRDSLCARSARDRLVHSSWMLSAYPAWVSDVRASGYGHGILCFGQLGFVAAEVYRCIRRWGHQEGVRSGLASGCLVVGAIIAQISTV